MRTTSFSQIKKIFFILTLCLASESVFSQTTNAASSTTEVPAQVAEKPDVQTYTYPDGRVVEYSKPKFLEVVTRLPEALLGSTKEAFTKDKIVPWIVIGATTVYLYDQDPNILYDIQKQGRDSGIGNEDNTKPIISIGKQDILRLPTDTGSLLYFLGDGWMHFGIAGGFYYYGEKNLDYRAQNTSFQILHGMALSTFFSQFLKRGFGRESPIVRTEERGRWRPFPSVMAYAEKTANYDAMPSGHIMTASLVATIINQNYQEYSNYIIPASVVWVSALGWGMVNNGVHWASDYPLGIGMGIFYGNYVVRNWPNRKVVSGETTTQLKPEYHFLPLASSDQVGLMTTIEF